MRSVHVITDLDLLNGYTVEYILFTHSPKHGYRGNRGTERLKIKYLVQGYSASKMNLEFEPGGLPLKSALLIS